MYHVWVGAARFELALVGPKTTVLTKLDDTPKVALLTRALKNVRTGAPTCFHLYRFGPRWCPVCVKKRTSSVQTDIHT